jgi:hypothetical protein
MQSVKYQIYSDPPAAHDTISMTQFMPIVPNRARHMQNLRNTISYNETELQASVLWVVSEY